MIKTDDGQASLRKSKDRIDHWTAESGEVILADQDKYQCELNVQMRTEAENIDSRDNGIRGDEVEAGPERFDISGSPAKEPEEETVLASRAAIPTERRLRTPERTPTSKRRTENNECITQETQHGRRSRHGIRRG